MFTLIETHVVCTVRQNFHAQFGSSNTTPRTTTKAKAIDYRRPCASLVVASSHIFHTYGAASCQEEASSGQVETGALKWWQFC